MLLSQCLVSYRWTAETSTDLSAQISWTVHFRFNEKKITLTRLTNWTLKLERLEEEFRRTENEGGLSQYDNCIQRSGAILNGV